MAKVTIRTKRYETCKKAEWRYFSAAMLEDKFAPQDVLDAMKDTENIESAKRWLNGSSQLEKEQSIARQRYLNTSKEIDKEIELMISQPGFTTNDGYE